MYISQSKKVDQNNELSQELKRKLSLLKIANKNVFVSCSQVILTKNHYYIVWRKENKKTQEGSGFISQNGEMEIINLLSTFRKAFTQLKKLSSYHGHLNQKSIRTHKSTQFCQLITGIELNKFKKIIQIQEMKKITFQENNWMIYYPPEVYLQKKFSEKTDIWAFGVIIYRQLYGNFPWNVQNLTLYGFLHSQVYCDIQFPKREDISPKLTHLIYCCLKPDEDLRFCYLDFLDSQIFQDFPLRKRTKMDKMNKNQLIEQLSSMKTLNSCQNYNSQQKVQY